MAKVTRSQIINFMWPGLSVVLCDSKYYNSIYKQIFKVMQTKKAYDVVVEYATMGYAKPMNEGESYEMQSNSIVNRTLFSHCSFGAGIEFSFEAIDDNLYTDEFDNAGTQIKHSLVLSRDVNAANVFNFASSSTAPIGDGQPAASANHPTTVGVYSNVLSPATFSETALTDALTIAQTFPDAAGKILNYDGDKLVCSPTLQYDVARVLFNAERPGTANRDIGVIHHQGLIKGGYIVNPYLTDANKFFLLTSCPNSLLFYEKNMAETSTWMEEKTRTVGMGGFDRYSSGVANARGLVCSQSF
jgi:hypothetical protein